jgi:hypothetical protein
MDDATRKTRLPQTLNRTKAGKLLEDQARDVEEKRAAKLREFESGEKRYTEGK